MRRAEASKGGATADDPDPADMHGRLRHPDGDAEREALRGLADRMGARPEGFLDALVATVLELFGCGSAAVTAFEPAAENGVDQVRWIAVGGELCDFHGQAVPAADVPCGPAMARDTPLHLRRPGDDFPLLGMLPAPVHELIVVPFHLGGAPAGTLCALSHVEGESFDAGDLRLLGTLARFTSAGFRLTRSLQEAREANHANELRAREHERALAEDLADIARLQEASTALIKSGEVGPLYDDILQTAVALMRADRGSMQLLDEASDELVLIAWHGVSREFVEMFRRWPAHGGAVCDHALERGQRVVVPDLERSELVAGDVRERLRADGIRSVQSTPLISRGGRVIGMISTHWDRPHEPGDRQLRLLDILGRQVADLIERSQVEQALRSGERRYRSLAELSPSGILVELDGRVVFANRALADLLGAASVDELIGAAVSDCIDCDGETAVQAGELEALSDAGAPGPREACWRRRDGICVDVEISSSSIGWEGREAVQRIVRDITASKRYEREREEYLAAEAHARRSAEQASRAKDEFLAMLGHELRNPLAPIATALQVMRMEGRASREQDILERQVAHLTRLVDDLLDVSRITRGKIELARRRLELSEILDRAVEIASPLLEQRRHRVEVNVPREGLCVEADPQRMAQVLSNLLTNASKYSDPGSRITVRARRVGDRMRISVLDQGVGIAPEQLQGIFEPFVQQAQSLDRARGGLGLGLTIVRSIVEQHGGSVHAHSDGPGLGSEFIVELPPAREGETRPGAASAGAGRPRPAAAAGLRVLIVDDNLDAATMLRWVLEASGHRIAVALDGPGALAVAEEFEPQVALLDIGLPVMDGYELARHLQERHGPGLRMIAVTGYGQEEDRARCLEAGFQEHLVKPVDVDRLEELIRSGPPPASE